MKKKDLLKRIEELERRISNLERIPSLPTVPVTATLGKCSLCGMDLYGVMGYVCSNPYCPTFTKTTCIFHR